MTDSDKLKNLVGNLSQRYHFHETQTIRAFHREEARLIKEMVEGCGLELEENHVGNSRYEKWMEAKRGNE